MKSRIVEYDDHGVIGSRLYVWCPACQEPHTPGLSGPGPRWRLTGTQDRPTLAPSIRVHSAKGDCHSFLRNGRWEYLYDCWHSLGGCKLPLPDLPDWLEGPSLPFPEQGNAV